MLAAVVFIKPSVGYQQQHTVRHQSNGLPPLLAVFNPVLSAYVQWIVKHPFRRLKTDTVLSQVAGAFIVIL